MTLGTPPFNQSIETIKKESLNQLFGEDSYPFMSYEYLHALEKSNSVNTEIGWSPFHLSIHDGDAISGFMPLYKKNNSFGEFVFDLFSLP